MASASRLIGLPKRTYDVVGKFLGLTEGTPLQRKLALLPFVYFRCSLFFSVVVSASTDSSFPQKSSYMQHRWG